MAVQRRKWSEIFCVRATHIGKGLFARKQIRSGQTLGEIDGEIIVDRRYQSRHCIELSETRVLEPGRPFCFMNHSCEPNCELFSWKPDKHGDDSHRVFVQAIRTIRTGDELTIDYAWEAEAAIPCRCKSENCRGWIVAADELDRVIHRSGRRKRRPKRNWV